MKALRLVLANGVCLLGAAAAFGAESFSYEKAGVTYQVVRFTDTAAAQSWTVPEGVAAVDVLAVGGGGAGGAAKYNKAYCGAGGGGAGAFIYNEGLAVAPGQVFTVKVGKGGIASMTAVPGDGEASEVENETANISLTAAGGGHGGGCVVGAAQGGNGGCGGGGYGAKTLGGDPVGNGRGTIGGTGAKVFKSDGTTVRGILGGGGGAGFAGPSARSYDGCSGGDGLFCRITGVSVCYGGGGGGGAAQANNGNTGNGGAGGGGKGGDEGVGVAGTDGLGGGGGGGSSKGSSSTTVFAGGNGGSGVVVIRYATDMETVAVPSNLSPNGTMVNVHNAKQKEFLAMSESEIRAKFADSSWRGTISKQGDCLPLPVTFSWTGGGCNTVKVYNADGSLFLEKAVRGNSAELWGFDIGTNYTWEVVNSVKGASARAAFTTELEVPRMFRDPNFDEVTFDGSSTCTRKLTGVINMRELGGYVGLDGKRIRTGRLIRTARITENSLCSRDPGRIIGDSFVKTDAARAFWLDTLGIRTQVDLRDPDEYGSDYIDNETGGVLGPSVRWVKFTTANDEQAIPCYDGIFTEQGKANYKQLLDEMLNPANHPIVFHCSAGKDRTGTVAYILEAILGVSDEDKFRDWVALVLSSTDTQFSPTGAYDPLVAGFGAYEGETQNDKVVSFVKSLGVTDSQIEVFRTAMLEGYGEPVVPPEEHPYTVTWTGAAGDGLWATAGNWDKELTNVDSVLFTNDATVTIATATPGAALTVGSGKTVTIKGTAGVTAEFTGATVEYQALADGATLIADGGTGFRLTSGKGFRFGSDTTYRVLNGCYSKLSGLRIGDSKKVCFETDASHLKFDINGVLSTGGEIVCRTANASGLLELGTAKLTAGTLKVAIENGAETTASDLQDNGAIVALSVGTNADFRVTGGEDHLFYLGATAGSSLDFHGPSPKVQLSYCNAVNLGANLVVRLTPEADWSDWSLIQKPSAPGICTISSAIHYEIDTRALADVKEAFSFYLYKSGSTTDKHNIAVPAANNVTLVGPYADGFEATFSKPDNYQLMITLTPKKNPQPTVDDEPVITSPADYSTVELLSPGLKTYNTDASTYQVATYRTKNTDERKSLMADIKTNDLPVVLGWTGLSGACSVRVYRVRDGENAQPVFAKDGVAESSVAFDYAEVGRNYRWTVTDGTTTLTGHFFTRLTAPRIFRQINNYSSPQHNYLLGNCRDLGGWTNTAGKVVRQGLFFRCEEWDFLDGVKDESGAEHLIYDHYDQKYAPDAKRFWCDTVGVVLDIDLRAKADVMKSYMPDPAYEPGVDIHNSPISYDLVNRPIRRFYCDDLTGSGFPSYQNLNSSVGNRLAFYHTFTNFVASARTGRALIFHCSQGKDRTGSLAYVVNGLLGVPRHDLDLDWIYSWAEDSSITLDSTWSIDLVYNDVVGKYAGATLADKCAAYVTQCYADAGEPSSLAAADIADFRARMLEEPETPADIPADRTVWLGKPGDFTTAANWSAGVPSSVLPGEFPMLSTNVVTLSKVTELDASTLSFGARSETVFSGEGGVSSRVAGDYQLLGPGATLVARNGAGADGVVTSLDFAVADDSRRTASALIGDGVRLVAENGGTIAVDGAFAADAGSVALVARGASSGLKSQVAFAPLDNLAKGNTNVVLKAEGNARVLIRKLRKDGDTWNPGKGLSGAMPTVTVIERSGGSVDCSNTYVEGARLKIDAEDGALISFDGLPTLAGGSDIRLSNTTLRVAWNEANFGANETTIALRGDTPAVTVYPYDDDGIAKLSLRKNLTVTLAPTPAWSGTQGRFVQPNAKHGRTVVESGVKFVVDVSALAGQTGSRTFRIVETKNDDRSYTELNAPAADLVSVTGTGADTATVTFAVTDDRKCLDMTVTFPELTLPTVDGEPVGPAEVFAMARSNKPIEYPSAPEVAGEVGVQTIVFGGVSVPVPRHYTATLSGNTVTLALNDFARPVLADSDDDKKAIAVGKTTVTLHIGQRIDGLYYRVVTTGALDGEWTPVTEFLPVGDFTVDRKATDMSAFYRIEASDVGGVNR